MTFTVNPTAECRVRGLGDAVSDFLESYRVKKGDCGGCKKRRKNLNDFTAAHPTIANAGVKILDALKRK